MLTERIKARANDANHPSIAHITGRRLTFHKISTRKNGSRTGKCDICIDPDPKAVVYGVLFEIPESQFDDLNTFEKSYSLVELVFHSPRLGAVTAVADLADRTDATLIPYDWYRDLVLDGALQHAIPKPYIRDYIQSVRVEHTRGSTYRDAKEAKALLERIRNAQQRSLTRR